MLTITQLPDEMILYTLRKLYLIHECLGFLSTCRSLWSLTKFKALWVHILECARWYRPVKLPGPIHKISVETLQDSIARSMKLDHLLEQKTFTDPVRVWELIPAPEDSAQRSQSEDIDPPLCACLLQDGIHLLTFSKSGLMKLWDIHARTIIFRAKLSGEALCWDLFVDDLGMTMVMITILQDSNVETFSVWHYDWSDLEPREVVSKVMEERTNSVWASKELAGCVGIHQGSNVFTYVVNWKTSCEVFIDTGIKTNSSVLVTVSPRVLIIYIDDGDFVRIACWYLNRIQELLESSMEIKREDPFFEQSYITDRQGQGSAYGWDCNIKCLWDERIGIFCSCSLDEELRGDYTVLFTIPWDESYVPYNSPSKAMSHIHIARCITGEGHLLSPEDAPLYSFGIFGKTVVWLDNPSNPPGGNPTYERMCFANFPPHRRPNPANSEEETPIFLSRTARKALLNDILNTLEDLSDQERNEFMQRNADELLHEIATQFPQAVADQGAQAAIDNVPQIAADGTVQEITEDSDEERTSETSQGAFTSTESSSMDYPADFGDICEFPVPQEWVRKYKDIYMIDFDDARGRLAFATGSGIILIVELV